MTNASPPASPKSTTPRSVCTAEWSTVVANHDSPRMVAGPDSAVPPLVIIPHELGHYLVLLAMDVPNPVMHYATVTWDSREFWEAVRGEDYATAADHRPNMGRGALQRRRAARFVRHGRGMLLRLRPVASACRAGRRRLRVPAPRCWSASSTAVLVLLGGDPPASYDELRVAELTGIPVQVLVGFGVAVIWISGAWLAR